MLGVMMRGVWIVAVVAGCGGGSRPIATEPAPRDEPALRDESALVTRPSQVADPVVERAPELELATAEEIRSITSDVPPIAGREKLPMLRDEPKPIARCDGKPALDEAKNLIAQGSDGAAIVKLEHAYRCDPQRDTLRWLVLTACRARRYDYAKHYFVKLDARDQPQMAQLCQPPSFVSER